MAQNENKRVRDQGQQKNAKNEVQSEARRRASEQGRDWKTMTADERKSLRQEARKALKEAKGSIVAGSGA
jgi:hypothetical protein